MQMIWIEQNALRFKSYRTPLATFLQALPQDMFN